MLNFTGRIYSRCFRDGEGAVASYLVCDVISFRVVETKGYRLIYRAGYLPHYRACLEQGVVQVSGK